MSRKTSKVDTTTTISLTMNEAGKMESAPVQYDVNIPLQLLTPIYTDQSSADIERELEEKCKLHTGYIGGDGPFAWCTITSYATIDGIVRAVMLIPDNPVQIIIRRDPESNIQKIEMINLEDATPKQIRDAVKYIKPLQERVIGHTRRSDMTKEYNAAYEVIMAAPPAEQAKAKKQVKKVFLANHGEDYSTAFDMAMYRRGYKKQRKT